MLQTNWNSELLTGKLEKEIPHMGSMLLGSPTCFSPCHHWASPYMQSGSFSHAIRWKARPFPVFPVSVFFSVSTQSNEMMREKQAQVKFIFKGDSTKARFLCHVIGYTWETFISLFGWVHSTKTPCCPQMADACCWYMGKGKRKLWVSLAYDVPIFLTNLSLMEFSALS